jgi:hypothetical protein
MPELEASIAPITCSILRCVRMFAPALAAVTNQSPTDTIPPTGCIAELKLNNRKYFIVHKCYICMLTRTEDFF